MAKNVWKKLMLVLLMSVVASGCMADEQVLMDVSRREGVPGMEVKAKEEWLDRSSEDWLRDYCLSRIEDVVEMPVAYERQRGPLFTLNPTHRMDRYVGSRGSQTCTLDYYYWPVRAEAFLDMDVEYAYNKQVWEDFYEAVTASVSANLADDGWRVSGGGDEDGADLAMSRYDYSERINEYLDVYFEKDEEVVFELILVVD